MLSDMTTDRRSSKSLAPDDAERVRAALVRFVDAEGSQVAVARRLGVTQQSVSQVISGASAPGVVLASKLASATGVAFDALLSGRPTTTRVVYDSRYPNLDAAIQFAGASSSPVSAEAVEHVRSFALKSAEDLPAEKWLEELRYAERSIRDRAGPQLPGREMPAPEKRAPLAERVAKAKAKK